MSNEEIESIADWEGEPGKFVSALVDIGFLDGEKGDYSLHDWAEHNPWAASTGMRIESATNAARKRWMKAGMREVSGSNAGRIKPQCPNRTVPTVPNPTIPMGGESEVTEIWRCYPGNAHRRDQLVIPAADVEAIANAIGLDGADKVLEKTKAFADAVSLWSQPDRQYIKATSKFYRDLDYRKDPAEWSRSSKPPEKKPQPTLPDPNEKLRAWKKRMAELSASEAEQEKVNA